jgi:Rrf2 family protein
VSHGISRAAQYAVRTLVHLALSADGAASPVRDIAEAEGIPPHFLAKLVGKLARAGLVDALKGPGGGVRLAVPTARIKLIHVIEAVDGPAFLSACFLGLPSCSDEQPCAMHENWKVLRARLAADFERITIAELAASARRSPPAPGAAARTPQPRDIGTR